MENIQYRITENNHNKVKLSIVALIVTLFYYHSFVDLIVNFLETVLSGNDYCVNL